MVKIQTRLFLSAMTKVKLQLNVHATNHDHQMQMTHRYILLEKQKTCFELNLAEVK